MMIGAAVLAVLFLLPVRQSVLAPAEVVPLEGQVVAAPLDGVIARFVVQPNQPVRSGDVLLRFEDTSLRAQADVAERSLQVAEAERDQLRAFTAPLRAAVTALHSASAEGQPGAAPLPVATLALCWPLLRAVLRAEPVDCLQLLKCLKLLTW